MRFSNILKAEFSKHEFVRFDTFLIKELGYDVSVIDDDIRMEAFNRFRELTGNHMFASVATMKKWFGIAGFATPRREQVYEICFMLHVPEEKVSDYFTVGLSAPAFQINDYQEAIFMYGIHKELSFDECLRLIEMFENNLEENRVFDHTQMTYQLRNQFNIKKELSETEFIAWMLDYSSLFKGYSKTSLDYLETLRNEIIKQMKKDASERLNEYLAETGYELWKRKNSKIGEEEKNVIKRYIKKLKNDKISKLSGDIVSNINELYKIVYGEAGANTQLLAEVYSSKNNIGKYPDWIKRVDAKYLSDLFNIPDQKERQIRSRQAVVELRGMSDNAPCPAWIVYLIEKYSKEEHKKLTVKEAKEWLEKDMSEHKRRCHIVQRGDLLPLILHMAQNKHMQVIHYDYSQYDSAIAKEEFVRIANATLSACNMEPLSDAYQLDVALSACFQQDELFSYLDIIDALAEM